MLGGGDVSLGGKHRRGSGKVAVTDAILDRVVGRPQ